MSGQVYDTGVYKTHAFTAYNNQTFEPICHLGPFEHAYHRKGFEVGNTTNDMLLGIWSILRCQAKWLEEKLKDVPCPSNVTQEDLNRQTEDIRNIVKRASRVIEDQNTEILEKFGGFKKEIEKVIKDENLDRKFGHVEKVIRDCLDDVEYRLSKLEKLSRNVLEEVSISSGKTEMEKLVLENNNILRRIEEEKLFAKTDIKNITIPGLEQLVKKEDLNYLEKQIDTQTLVRKTDLKHENILEKLHENQKMLKNLDMKEIENVVANQKGELKMMLEEISRKIDKVNVNKFVQEGLAQAQQHLTNISQLIGAESD